MATQAPTDAEKECHSMEGPFPSITLARPSTGRTLEVSTSFQLPTLCGPVQGRGFVSLGLRFLICEVGMTVGYDDKGGYRVTRFRSRSLCVLLPGFYARHPEPSLVNGSTGAGP